MSQVKVNSKVFYHPSPRLNPINSSYPDTSFPSGPLPLRSELEGAVVEISPYQMEQDPHTSSVVIGGI